MLVTSPFFLPPVHVLSASIDTVLVHRPLSLPRWVRKWWGVCLFKCGVSFPSVCLYCLSVCEHPVRRILVAVSSLTVHMFFSLLWYYCPSKLSQQTHTQPAHSITGSAYTAQTVKWLLRRCTRSYQGRKMWRGKSNILLVRLSVRMLSSLLALIHTSFYIHFFIHIFRCD